jgi:hypothetical protein
LVVSSVYSGYYNYTDYEEVWLTDTSGGSPAFDFYFYDNYWVPVRGGENAATWTSYSSGAPSNVAVTISGNSVLVHNPLATEGAVVGAPAVSSSDAPAPVGYLGYGFFAVDSSNTLWHTNGSGTWDSLGGICTSSPAAVSWYSTDLRIDVFVRGSDGAVWWKYYQNGGWSGWQSLGGKLAPGAAPAVTSWGAGRLDVFVEGQEGNLWHKGYDGAWAGWQNLGGKLTSSPGATSNATNNIQVFVRGSDGALWWKHWDGSAWSGWTSLLAQVAPNTGPAVSQDLWLFVQGTDHQLWRSYYGGPPGWWSAWGPLAGMPPDGLSTASPAAMLPHQDALVCVSSTSGNVWWSGDSLANWNLWYSIGSPP